jgi:hypothetical protein
MGLKTSFRFLGLFLGTFGVIAYKEIPYPYNILCWVPITFGYAIWFGEWLK